MWQIKRDNGKSVWYIDGEDLTKANWLRYVNCARHEDEQNLIAFQFKGRIYYRTYKAVSAGEELLVYYGDEYARQLGIEQLDASDKPVATAIEKSAEVSSRLYKPQIKNRPFKCTECSCSYSHKGNLTKHSRIHTGVNLHRCELCPKIFTHKTNLITHIRTHTGEKPFRCTTCDKGFTQASTLTDHIRTHTGEKPFICTTCDKGFKHNSALTVHIRTHTGEKPYECMFCNAKFSDISGRNKHQKNNHKVS